MFPDRLGDLGGRAGAVHEDDALGHVFREEQVALADVIVEIDVLALHAVGQVGGALLEPGEAHLGGHVDHDGDIGHDVADGEAVDLRDGIGGQLAGDALINGGGIEEAVAEHVFAGEKRGRDDLAHQLRAGGGEEQQLGLGTHLVALGVVDDDVADLLADLGAAGLAGGDDVLAGLLQMGREQGNLGGFAAAFGAFEGDEFAGGLLMEGHTKSLRGYFQLARKVSRSARVGLRPVRT